MFDIPGIHNNCIYRIFNKINDQCYIGSTKSLKRRARAHRRDLLSKEHHSKRLQNAWNKYGAENFELEIIAYCVCAEDLIPAEQFFIEFFAEPGKKKPAYNMRAKANSMLGYKHSSETRKKLSRAHSGSKLSKEHREAISRAQKERGPFRDRKPIIRTCPKTGEQKVYESSCSVVEDGFHQGHVNEVVRGRFNTHAGYYREYLDRELRPVRCPSKKKRGGQRPDAKPVVQLDARTGKVIKVYEYTRQVVEDGFDRKYVSLVCRGKAKTHRGFKWKYLDEYK